MKTPQVSFLWVSSWMSALALETDDIVIFSTAACTAFVPWGVLPVSPAVDGIEFATSCSDGVMFTLGFALTKWQHEQKQQKTLDGKCDGYMWGFGGAKKRKC